ncbi:unnamed protein product [Blepharisma stoltei]|uniref:Uncharacterized protein n=1 Tax=Blepharisma stoltei TaxID=1481888 RepID=A0AAU9J096_9CILI|nr:unnamed protein product [Blepharisma stoltei]
MENRSKCEIAKSNSDHDKKKETHCIKHLPSPTKQKNIKKAKEDLPNKKPKVGVPNLKFDNHKSSTNRSCITISTSQSCKALSDRNSASSQKPVKSKSVKKKNLITPRSTKSKRSGSSISKTTNESSAITHPISSERIQSSYESKIPIHSDLSKSFVHLSQSDLQNIILNKTFEFQEILENELKGKPKTPYQISKEQRLKAKNQASARKRDEIKQKLEEEELERAKKSAELFHKSCEFRLKRAIENSLKKYQTALQVEDAKMIKEQQKTLEKQKQVAIESIQNFYNDRIQLLKERIDEQKFYQKIVEYDQKKRLSEAEKLHKAQRKKQLKEQASLLHCDDSDFLSLEAKEFEERIIERYKKESFIS